MEPSLHYLRDIRGVDPVPWWPPAPGWWMVGAALLLVALLVFWWDRRIPENAWRRDANRRIRALRRRLQTESPKVIAGELSELLRRVAIVRCGRRPCAGLVGDSWLDWLHDNDPTGFAWKEEGRLLLQLPYAPPEFSVGEAELQRLVDASLRWVAATVEQQKRETSSRARLWQRLREVRQHV